MVPKEPLDLEPLVDGTGVMRRGHGHEPERDPRGRSGVSLPGWWAVGHTSRSSLVSPRYRPSSFGQAAAAAAP
jgi:hypothetical protein